MPELGWKLASRLGALLLLGFFLLLISLPNLIVLDNLRPQVLSFLRSRVAGEIEIGKLSLTFRHGPGIRIDNVAISDSSGKQDIRIATAILNFKFRPLFKRHLQVKRIVLVQPRIRLELDGPHAFSAGFLRPKPVSLTAARHKTTLSAVSAGNDLALGGGWRFIVKLTNAELKIVDGGIIFIDSLHGSRPVTTHLDNLKLSLKWFQTGAPAEFMFHSRVIDAGGNGFIRIDGVLSSLQLPLRPSQIFLDCQIEAENLNGGNYFPYYSRYVPMQFIGGRIDIDTTYQGNLLGLFHSRGEIVLHDVEFDYPRVFGRKLSADRLAISCDFRLADHYNTIEIKDCNIALDDFKLVGSCLLRDVRSGIDGKIDAGFSVPRFDPASIVPLLPAALLPEAVNQVFASLLPGGYCQLKHAFLRGSYRQLLALSTARPPGGIVGAELEWRGFACKNRRLGPDLLELDGDLKLTDDLLEIQDASIEWGGARIDRLRASIQRIYSDPFLELSCHPRFELAPLWTQLQRLSVRPGWRTASPGSSGNDRSFALSAGVLDGLFRARGPLLRPGEMNFRGKLQAAGVAFSVPVLKLPVSGLGGEINVDEREIVIDKVKGSLGDLVFNLRAGLAGPRNWIDGSGKLEKTLDCRLSCREISPDDISRLLPPQAGFSLRGKTAGPSRLALRLRGDLRHPKALQLNGDVDLDWSELMLSPLSFSLDRFRCRATFNQHEIRFRHLCLQKGGSDLAFRGSLYNGSGERFLKGEISSSNLVLGDFLKGGRSRPLSWPPGLKVELSGRLDHLLLPSATGEGGPVGQNAPWQNLYQCRFSLSGDPDTGLGLKHFSWLWGEQKGAVSIKADIDSFPDVSGRIVVEADNLDLDELLRAPAIEVVVQEEDAGEGGGTSPDKVPDRITAFEELTDVVESDEVSRLMEWKKKLAAFDLQVKVRARHLAWKNMVLDQLAGEATVDKSGVDITRIDGRSFDGDIYFSGNWRFADDLFSLDSEFSGINFEKFNDYLKNPDRGLPMQGGKGSMNLALDWQGRTLPEWKKSLDGLVSFNFKDGKLKRFTLISNICSLLNVSQFASLHLPKFSDGVPYRSLTGQGTIVDGVITIDDFTLQGPGLNLLATGKVSLLDEEIDLKMGIQPLQTVDKLLATIPVLGYIMTGDKKTFVIIPVTAKGPFSDVKISTKTVNGLGEKVGDVIQRFFETPVRLFKMSGKILQPGGQ